MKKWTISFLCSFYLFLILVIGIGTYALYQSDQKPKEDIIINITTKYGKKDSTGLSQKDRDIVIKQGVQRATLFALEYLHDQYEKELNANITRLGILKDQGTKSREYYSGEINFLENDINILTRLIKYTLKSIEAFSIGDTDYYLKYVELSEEEVNARELNKSRFEQGQYKKR